MFIGMKLRKLREEKGLDGKVLGELAGVTQSTISDIEQGKRSPTLNTVEKLCRALNISVIDLLPVEEHISNHSLTGDEKLILELLYKLDHDERQQFLTLFQTLLKDRK